MCPLRDASAHVRVEAIPVKKEFDMEMERKLSGGVFAASVRRERGQESPKQTVRRKPNSAPAGRKNARAGMEAVVHLIFLLCGIVAVAFVLFISDCLRPAGHPDHRAEGVPAG